MAVDKPGFVLYSDLIFTVDKMTDIKAGKLFKTILRYVNDQNPLINDETVDLVFEPIKQQLKRDLKKYEGTKKKNSEKGALGNLKRWHLDLYERVIKGEIDLTESLIIAEDRKVSLGDKIIANVADTDTGKDTGKDIDINKSDKKEITKVEQWILDLENGSHIIEIARKTEMPVQYFKDRIAPFKKASNSNYPDHYKFLDHFKSWSLQNKTISLQPVKTGSSIKLGRR